MPDRLTCPIAFVATFLVLAGCASKGKQEDAGSTPAPASGSAASATSTGTAATAAPAPSHNQPWPIKTRQHLDTWLHGFAMLEDDTARVPFFRRGYRDQLTVIKNQQNVHTALDANREKLRAGLAAHPELINAQFFPFQVTSWEETRQFVDYFLRAEGDPRRAGNQQVAQMIAIVAQYFPSAADREWLQLFMSSLEDERTQFYNLYWINTQRQRASVLAATDSLWQLQVRPKLQGYARSNQLANGDLILSLPLGGEGRTQLGNSARNVVAVTFPETREHAADAVFAFVHEIALPLATTVVSDNVTPTERRTGVADRYLSSAVVYGGYLVFRKSLPDMAEDYARFYLRTAGLPAPATGAGAALEREFALPQAMREALQRQIDITLGGI